MTNQIANKDSKNRWTAKDAGLLGHVKTVLEDVAAPARLRQDPVKTPYWQAD